MQELLSVVHKTETGWHTFTSLQVPGLFLVGGDEHLAELKDSLVPAIKTLVEADTGRKIWLEEVQSFSIETEQPADKVVLHFIATDLTADASLNRPW